MKKKKEKKIKEKRYKIFQSLYLTFQFKWMWKWLKGLFKKKDLMYAQGVHFISGYMGSGKTLYASHIINQYDKNKYFFLTNIPEFKQENVYLFNIRDYFGNRKQIKRFPLVDGKGRKLISIIFDEINLDFNRRENRSNEYNEIFIGLTKFLLSLRHQGIHSCYFIGQFKSYQDTQLATAFKYWHNIIYSEIGAFYKEQYVLADKGKKLKLLIKYLYMEDYQSTGNEEEPFNFLNISIRKVNYNDYLTYDTFGLRKQIESLDVGVVTKD